MAAYPLAQDSGTGISDLPDQAQRALVALLGMTNALVEGVRVRVTAVPERAAPVVVQLGAVVDGTPVRVQRYGTGSGQVAIAAVAALERRIAEVARAWKPRDWDGSNTTAGPCAGMSPAEGGIVRIKPVTPRRCSVHTAIRVMDAMDYDAHLFTDTASGSDAVVHRVGPTGYRLARVDAAPPPPRGRVPLTVCPRPAPRLRQDEAAARLTECELPYLFFADPDADPGAAAGRLLYRRFDGRLGLIRSTR